jgi:hypothetical protein
MKKAVFVFGVLLMLVFIAGCKTSSPQGQGDQAAMDAPPEGDVAQPSLIPFGLTLKWRAERIPLSDEWATKHPYGDKRNFPDWGMLVKEVLVGTQAETAGFKPGDYIFMVNDGVFANTSKFVRLMSGSEPGKPVEVRVVRTNPDGKKDLIDLSMTIPTDNITSFYFPIFFGYSKNDYLRKWHYAFLVLTYDRSSFSTHTWGLWPLYVPIYHRERVGSVVTQRIFWFIKWRVGPEEDITF